jgi:hypothetical protein
MIWFGLGDAFVLQGLNGMRNPANNHIQPTHNTARLFAHAFGIIAQTLLRVVVG